MNVWFYAPLKAPTHRSVSGDRHVARSIMRALQYAGHHVTLVSTHRSFDGRGNAARQRRHRLRGQRIAKRLVQRAGSLLGRQRPHVWFTYHLYHKAPDWIGPGVCDELDIPYVVAEASYAPKQERGPWSLGHAVVASALARADAVLALNRSDLACVTPLLDRRCRVEYLPPFIPNCATTVTGAQQRSVLARKHGLAEDQPWLLTVAMMRRGDKFASYRVLAEAMGMLTEERWQLIVVGDGTERRQVEALFEPLGTRVVFAGLCGPAPLAEWYGAADGFVWPAVNEAFGMALLEAQAAGLAAVAGDTGGVGDIVETGVTGLLVPTGDAEAFAQATRQLLNAPAQRREFGVAARSKVQRKHTLRRASVQIDHCLRQVVR